ncbi:MAG TPA: NAD(P)-dependent oxidoreductase [Fimbriimonadaceae bacterium]|jgi:nucleoside-diphosphate-sugar epimerase
MKILLTGASSFTGFWFAKKLAEAGHEVVCTFTQSSEDYTGIRNQRVEALSGFVRPVFQTAVGDGRFLELTAEGCFDLFCSHGAYMVNYRSPGFDYSTAYRQDTLQLSTVLKSLKTNGTKAVMFTGTVFEPDEGAGSDGQRAVSAYGAVKRSVYEMYKVFSDMHGLSLAKFVIPNPFGTYEDPKLPAYLMKTWKIGDVPEIKTPLYVRDNIHVDLLAKSYVRFCEQAARSGAKLKLNPSQYIETQGQFVERFASEMRTRLGWKCEVKLARQTDFPEPRIRVNTDPADEGTDEWDEGLAWDAIAQYYANSPDI